MPGLVLHRILEYARLISLTQWIRYRRFAFTNITSGPYNRKVILLLYNRIRRLRNAPGEIRTHDLGFAKRLLYPTELQERTDILTYGTHSPQALKLPLKASTRLI